LGLRAKQKRAYCPLTTKKRALHPFRPENMSRTPSNFRQTDISRALKAIRAAGYSAVRVLIGKDGQIDITTAAEDAPAAVTPEGVKPPTHRGA
jgi:hypothetical protein